MPCDREQPFLLPVDTSDWVPSDDLARFVIEAVDHVGFQRFRVNERGTGPAQCEPRMTLALPIHCYASGIFSSRRIERAACRDIGARFAAASLHPDRDTIARFRRENFDAVAECFLQALLPAREANVLEVGAASVDGARMDGSASKRRSATCAGAGEPIKQLQGGIRELPARAEDADALAPEDAARLPREIARREDLERKLEEARERLEREARQRAEAGRSGCERKARNGAGRAPQPPSEEAGPRRQSNLTDPGSALVRENAPAEFRQGYDAQATADADGSQRIPGQGVTRGANDRGELAHGAESIPAEPGRLAAVLADNGYASEAEVAKVEATGVEACVATGAEGRRRQRDFRPETGKEPQPPQKHWLRDMAGKLTADGGRDPFKLRERTAEPVFIVKSVPGFRSFSLRGIGKVTLSWRTRLAGIQSLRPD